MILALALLLLAAPDAAPATTPAPSVSSPAAPPELPPDPAVTIPPPPRGVYPCSVADQRRAEVNRKNAREILGPAFKTVRVACPLEKKGAKRCDEVTYHCGYPIGRSGHWFTKSLNVTFAKDGRVVGWR